MLWLRGVRIEGRLNLLRFLKSLFVRPERTMVHHTCALHLLVELFSFPDVFNNVIRVHRRIDSHLQRQDRIRQRSPYIFDEFAQSVLVVVHLLALSP